MFSTEEQMASYVCLDMAGDYIFGGVVMRAAVDSVFGTLIFGTLLNSGTIRLNLKNAKSF